MRVKKGDMGTYVVVLSLTGPLVVANVLAPGPGPGAGRGRGRLGRDGGDIAAGGVGWVEGGGVVVDGVVVAVAGGLLELLGLQAGGRELWRGGVGLAEVGGPAGMGGRAGIGDGVELVL